MHSFDSAFQKAQGDKLHTGLWKHLYREVLWRLVKDQNLEKNLFLPCSGSDRICLKAHEERSSLQLPTCKKLGWFTEVFDKHLGSAPSQTSEAPEVHPRVLIIVFTRVDGRHMPIVERKCPGTYFPSLITKWGSSFLRTGVDCVFVTCIKLKPGIESDHCSFYLGKNKWTENYRPGVVHPSLRKRLVTTTLESDSLSFTVFLQETARTGLN